MNNIYLNAEQKEIVLSILKKYFTNEKFFIFGSRASGKNLKPFSDLDIAVQSSKKISMTTLAKTLEAFSASDLPFKVDLIDLQTISEEFNKNIKMDMVEIHFEK